MKAYTFKRSLLLSVAQVTLLFALGQKNIAGMWEGKMSVGVDVRVLFTFSVDANKNFQLVLEMPDQGIKSINNTVSVSGDSVKIEIKEANAVYAGRFVNDSLIAGAWKRGQVMTMNLRKIEKFETITRRQTPVPPFPYRSEDVEYYNKDKSIKYAGTITIPPGKGPFPAALLLTGSGQQNRDEQIGGHKPFAVIADYLTKRGFIILRVDDRGIGGTTGDVANATTADFADDAEVGVEYLKTHKEVDKKKIGLIGHSEGGMIAPMIAAKRNDIDFIVLLAAPGMKITEVMAEQNLAILTSAGLPKASAQAYTNLYSQLLAVINSTNSVAEAREKMVPIVNQWVDTTAKNVVIQTTGIFNDAKKNDFINSFSKIGEGSWYRYFLKYDAAPALEQLSSKVLALNGSRDIQIISASNLAGIRAALQKSSSKAYDVIEIPSLNHLFQTCKNCTLREYTELEESFAPQALDIIGAWLEKHVLSK